MIDSSIIQGALRKAAAAIIGFMLAMVLLTALLIAGFVLLVKAATLALSPWVGEAGALGITGLACLAILGLFFYRMTRPVTRSAKQDEEKKSEAFSLTDRLKNIIRKHPWEAVLAAFAIGVVQHGDPRLRALLLQGGMVLMKQGDSESAENDSESGNSGKETTETMSPETATADV